MPMNTQSAADVPSLDVVQPERSNPPVRDEVARIKIFLGIQVGFLLLSVVTGGFQFKLWSMLDL